MILTKSELDRVKALMMPYVSGLPNGGSTDVMLINNNIRLLNSTLQDVATGLNVLITIMRNATVVPDEAMDFFARLGAANKDESYTQKP